MNVILGTPPDDCDAAQADLTERGRLPSIWLMVPRDFPVKEFGEFLQKRNLQMVWNGRTQRVFEVMPRTTK